MTNTNTAKDNSLDVHLVPIFQKDLPAVFKLLSDRNPDRVSATGALPATSLEGSWTEANLAALRSMCKPVHEAILTRIAESGTLQKSATYEDLRAAGARASHNADFDYDNLRGNLAWISKYMIKVAGSKTGLFVFTDKGPDQTTGVRYEYRMPKATADAWLRIVRAR